MSIIKNYLVKNDEQYDILMTYFEKKGYRWNAGQKPKEYSREKYYPAVVNCSNGRFGCGMVKTIGGHIFGKYDEIPNLKPIKSEHQSAFKRMFRLNRIPYELTHDQKLQMSKENVMKLWTEKDQNLS